MKAATRPGGASATVALPATCRSLNKPFTIERLRRRSRRFASEAGRRRTSGAAVSSPAKCSRSWAILDYPLPETALDFPELPPAA